MSQTYFQQAADRYAEANRQEQAPEVAEANSVLNAESAEFYEDEDFGAWAGTIARASVSLEQFLASPEGQSALQLLESSKQHIQLARNSEGNRYARVYYIDGNGLQQSVEATGSWLMRGSDVPDPQVSSIDTHEAARVALDAGKYQEPDHLISWLRSELVKIAEAAPVPSA